MANKKKYIWCTYRDWSFQILEAIQDSSDWETGLIVTTQDCIYDFQKFENRGIPIVKIEPKKAKVEFQKGGVVYDKIMQIGPETIITPGWSWYIPKEILEYCPCVTFHPGKLPKDRGGSPIQNQMRNGEKWTYVNVMKQEEGLDEGGLYLKKKISLDGYADDVWKRMTSAGVLLTKDYLRGMGSGSLKPMPQPNEEPKIYKRVKPEDAELKPSIQSAIQMYNVIRAHYETDSNSYVVPAYIYINKYKIFVDRSSLELFKKDLGKPSYSLIDVHGEDLYQLIMDVNNNDANAYVMGTDGKKLFFRRCHVKTR